MKIPRLFLLLSATIVTSCSVYTKPQAVDEYLYSIEYSKYDLEKIVRFSNFLFHGKNKLPGPACSAVRCDSLFGRNFDWKYDEMPEFVIATTSAPGRYASIGIASPIGVLKDKQVKGLPGAFVLDKLPAYTVDGINEKGVACCINVVPQGDCGYTVGTNPGKPKMFAATLVRYVLDNAASANEAIELLNTRDFYTTVAFGLIEDYHFLIADSTSTFVVEFVNNRPVVLKDEMIMTNFYLSEGVTTHAIGVERYEILKKGYAGATSAEGMRNLLKSVWYSNFYSEKDSPWLSELCGENLHYGLNATETATSPEKFEKPLEEVLSKYQNRDRKNAETWHSVHTSVYNLYTGTLSVSTQESDRIHTFSCPMWPQE